ncbi:MAG: FAD binding domain-containing protein [Proteobacteria bacterium]|nr:FAD binding domain-containing protein [Pseudomonadota bacterium]
MMDIIDYINDFFSFQVGDSSLQIGAAISLSTLIGLLQENQSKSTSFQLLASHLLKIANVPVRNIGSWAGNLMLTHDHDNFPSDVFTMMAGVGAKVTIGELC